MPGPPPQPIERKRLLGNPGKQALTARDHALPRVPKLPTAPRGMGSHGRAAWRRLWAAAGAWLSPTTDLDILSRLCRAHDEAAHLRGLIERDGYTVIGSKGQTVAHPAVAMLRTLEGHMTRWESLCGFTPADRTRIGVAEVKRESTLDQLLARRAERAHTVDAAPAPAALAEPDPEGRDD